MLYVYVSLAYKKQRHLLHFFIQNKNLPIHGFGRTGQNRTEQNRRIEILIKIL